MIKDFNDPAAIEAFKAFVTRVRYEDGKLYWTKHRYLNGTRAGWVGFKGYCKIVVAGHGKTALHRVIFFMHHGYLPEMVDHIDRDITNNRIENLRAATNGQNVVNSKLASNNTSGHRGVRKSKSGKWEAHVRVDGKSTKLGTFANIDDAIAARKAAEKQQYGDFSRV